MLSLIIQCVVNIIPVYDKLSGYKHFYFKEKYFLPISILCVNSHQPASLFCI